MYNIFYFIHIPWGWAKQRPQFLAEELAKKYNLDVYYKQPLTFTNQSKETTTVNKYRLLLLPFQAKLKFIRFLNTLITKLILFRKFDKYTHIWLTSPELLPYIPKLKPNQFLIYDCMDDMLAFPKIFSNKNLYNFYHHNENQLINNSDFIFCTSDFLKNVIQSRYSIKKDIFVINNALSNNFFNSKKEDKSKNIFFGNDLINIVYLGTIAYWMDWKLIINSLEVNNKICYHFFGPCEVEVIKHDRIIYHGRVSHKDVNNILIASDILVMPFIINQLILSVNPVKLYEYIYSGKPVISVSYSETKYFEQFVYLYNNQKEYNNFINLYQNNELPAKANHKSSIEFCLKNTWEERVKKIINIINLDCCEN